MDSRPNSLDFIFVAFFGVKPFEVFVRLIVGDVELANCHPAFNNLGVFCVSYLEPFLNVGVKLGLYVSKWLCPGKPVSSVGY